MRKFTTYITEAKAASTSFTSATNKEIHADLERLGGGIEFTNSGPKGPVDKEDQAEFGQQFYAIKGLLGMEPLAWLKALGSNWDIRPSEDTLTGTKYATTWVVRKKSPGEDKDGKKYAYIGTHFINMSNPNNSIGKKMLTPNKLGLGGQTLNGKEIVKIVKLNIKKHNQLTDRVKDKLALCLDLVVEPGKNSIRGKSLEDLRKVKVKTDIRSLKSAGLTKPELATLSADFGEILAAVWATRNISFNTIHFPSNEAEPLVDFIGYFKPESGNKAAQPVSVKSGGCSVTSMKNLTEPLMKRFRDKAFKDTFNKREIEVVDTMLMLITQTPTMDGIIEMHKDLKTDNYKYLKSAMGNPSKITAATIRAWLLNKKSDEVRRKLKKFYSISDGVPKDAQWEKYDVPYMGKTKKKGFDDGIQEGIIIGPLGISLIKIMNSDEVIRGTLVKAARSITLLQVNVDVKSETMKFKQGQFVDFDFNFKWQGSSTSPNRNRFGFQAKVGR